MNFYNAESVINFYNAENVEIFFLFWWKGKTVVGVYRCWSQSLCPTLEGVETREIIDN